MECAAKGARTRCIGPPTRRCARCGAVAYCSVSHQIVHWPDHKEECGRLEQHMKQMDILNEFPFTFTLEATVQVCEKQETRCSVLKKRGVHQMGMWLYECRCGDPVISFDCSRYIFPLAVVLGISQIPFARVLPLTIYYATQVAGSGIWTPGISNKLYIHYLGPEKELHQLSVFSELHALFPNVHVHIELVGPSIPQHRDGEMIELCSYAHCLDRNCICKSSSETVNGVVQTSKPSAVTLQLRSGFYHDRYRDLVKDSSPHLIVAPNAGIAAYSSWLPTIELIRDMNIPAVFSDYCKEACHLGARCISSVTGRPLNIPATDGGGRQCSLSSLLLELLPLRDVKVVRLKLHIALKILRWLLRMSGCCVSRSKGGQVIKADEICFGDDVSLQMLVSLYEITMPGLL